MTLLMLFVLNALADDQHAVAISQNGQVAISQNGQEVEMSKREVKQLFTRQKMTWMDDQRVTVVLPLIGSPAMAWLSRQVLGLPPEVYHRYLLEKAYRAGEDPPQFVGIPTLIEGEMVLTVVRVDDYSSDEYSIVRIR